MEKRPKKSTSLWDWYNTHPGKLFIPIALEETAMKSFHRFYIRDSKRRYPGQQSVKGSRLG
jgi:hypothetical protein